MPLARYFLYIGGVLLGLLLGLDAWLPRLPAAQPEHANLPVIRIQSIQKPPERVVYDTSLPTITPAIASTDTGVQPPAMIADVSVGTTEREAFAQLPSPDAKALQRHDRESRERKPQRQRKFARRTMPRFAMARPGQFGWFGRGFW